MDALVGSQGAAGARAVTLHLPSSIVVSVVRGVWEEQ